MYIDNKKLALVGFPHRGRSEFVTNLTSGYETTTVSTYLFQCVKSGSPNDTGPVLINQKLRLRNQYAMDSYSGNSNFIAPIGSTSCSPSSGHNYDMGIRNDWKYGTMTLVR